MRIISTRIARIAHDLARNLRHDALAPPVLGKACRDQRRRIVSRIGIADMERERAGKRRDGHGVAGARAPYGYLPRARGHCSSMPVAGHP
jgi:hypothetical protein